MRRDASGAVSGTMTMNPGTFMMPAVPGAAYSAEQVTEHVQVLADGTRITNGGQTIKMFRDSQGRTRTERVMMGEGSPVIVDIGDPVAGFHYYLDTANKVAHRVTAQAPTPMLRTGAVGGMIGQTAQLMAAPAMVAPPQPPPPPGSQAVAVARVFSAPLGARMQNQPEMKMEDLGTQVIDGVLVQGTRHTQTWAAGSVGNDRAFSSYSEMWTSPELKLTVLSKNVDPRSGENTTKLTNLSRSEPDPSLFQVPGDYKLVDDQGPFSINFGRP